MDRKSLSCARVPAFRKLDTLLAVVIASSIFFYGCGGSVGPGSTPLGSQAGGGTTTSTITVTSISPTSGPTTGGTQITVTGTNFPNNATVTFGGVAATSVVINSQTSATVTTPVHAAGVVDVVVSVSGGASFTFSNAFTYFTPGAALQITTSSPLPDVLHGTAYSQQLTAIGGVGSGQTWSITAGALPAGLTLSSTTGLISGTPTVPGAAIFTVSVTDASGSTSKQFTLTVAATLVITSPTALTDAIVNGTYSQQITTTGGSGPQVWAVTAGALPGGMSLTPTTGIVNGMPTLTGSSSFTVTVTDNLQTVSMAFTLNVNNPIHVPGATQGIVYSFTPTAIPGATWSITSGALPSGLTINSATGTISGTPTVFGTFSFTLSSTTAGATSASSGFMIVSAAAPVVGNTGTQAQIYADEGGAPDPAATAISACGHLTANTSYKLTQSVTGGTFGPNGCLILDGPNVKLDLNGFTVNGPVYINADASGTVVFNGIVNCNNDDSNGGNTGCVNLLSQSIPSNQMRVHHLTVHNSGGSGAGPDGARSIHIDWEPGTPVFSSNVNIRVYNITSTVNNQPNVVRSHNLNVTAMGLVVEEAYNNFTCAIDAQACQGEVCFGVLSCFQHGNTITMPFNNTGETARGLVFDQVVSGEIWNNTVSTQNNRAVRVRDSTNADIHDNSFNNIQTSSVATAAVHLGDPDFGTDDLNAVVERNNFQINDGEGVFIRNAIDTDVRNNTVTCTGACSGLFVAARTPDPATCSGVIRPGLNCTLITTIVTVESNPTAGTAGLPAPQVQVAPGATATVCKSGTPGPFGAGGAGTIIPVNTCP